MNELRPLGDRVIVQRCNTEHMSPGGLHIPTIAEERPQKATVLAVGPGTRLQDGTVVPVDVRVGDTVLIAKFAGDELKFNGENVLIIRETDIYAVLT